MIGGDLKVARRGLMFILSSPSGAGKTTLAERLLEKDDEMVLSVSATTRQRRPGEAHGKDYYFVSEEEFTRMRDEGEFLEWANVFGHYYGTPRSLVEDVLRQGKDVLFDIDWQGAQQLDEVAGEDVVKVFILPPSREELERRLRQRAQDPEDVVQRRMAKADAEMSHWAEYDYVIVNYDLDESEELLRSILFAERLKRRRQIGLAAIVKEMIGEG
ncbi:guanylate kinase [Hyphococcus luteus]|uniref:Guanylate kinase n=1 Tax=Hyphococcus luteus TaxID=2058213 RepID=A0A2S7JZH7_9PROT|nr:guanylate kinase [Marinicaulis flavus]PQA85654.1 guanylate kinase [Marinicaulis flavus]